MEEVLRVFATRYVRSRSRVAPHNATRCAPKAVVASRRPLDKRVLEHPAHARLVGLVRGRGRHRDAVEVRTYDKAAQGIYSDAERRRWVLRKALAVQGEQPHPSHRTASVLRNCWVVSRCSSARGHGSRGVRLCGEKSTAASVRKCDGAANTAANTNAHCCFCCWQSLQPQSADGMRATGSVPGRRGCKMAANSRCAARAAPPRHRSPACSTHRTPRRRTTAGRAAAAPPSGRRSRPGQAAVHAGSAPAAVARWSA